jgi:hypothetical protein
MNILTNIVGVILARKKELCTRPGGTTLSRIKNLQPKSGSPFPQK